MDLCEHNQELNKENKMEIKYEPVFGEQLLLSGAGDEHVAVCVNDYEVRRLIYLTQQELDAKSEVELHAIPVIAMRRIIKTPVWTVSDQQAGRLPEVGAKCRQSHKDEIVVAVTEKFVVTECQDMSVCTTRKDVFMHSYNPIETPAEKAQRLEDEFFEQVKLGGMNANIPQKTSSLFELGVRAAYRKHLELAVPKEGE